VTSLSSALTTLATTTPPDPDDVTPGLLGFVVVASLALALWFLLRSMNNRLKNVKFEERDGADKPPGAPPRT
jgi:hypothetical protein